MAAAPRSAVPRSAVAAIMQDDLAQLEKLRKQAAELATIRDLAEDERELFGRLASHS